MGTVFSGVAIGGASGLLVDGVATFTSNVLADGMNAAAARKTAILSGIQKGAPIGAAAGGITMVLTQKDH